MTAANPPTTMDTFVYQRRREVSLPHMTPSAPLGRCRGSDVRLHPRDADHTREAGTSSSLNLAEVVIGPADGLDGRLADRLVARWERTGSDDPLLILMRAAASRPEAAATLTRFLHCGVRLAAAKLGRPAGAARSVVVTAADHEGSHQPAGDVAAQDRWSAFFAHPRGHPRPRSGPRQWMSSGAGAARVGTGSTCIDSEPLTVPGRSRRHQERS